jgi:signal transduction histidine kinase
MRAEAPNLAKLIESSAARTIPVARDHRHQVPANVEALLQGLPFFHDLTHEELHSVASIGQFESRSAGDVIFEAGDPGDALYVLITGDVSIFLRGEEGGRVELASLTDGAYFGDLALIDGEPRSAGALATKDSEFFLVGRSQFLRLLSESPRILADVLIGLSEHLRTTNQQYFDANEKRERLQTQAELERHQSIAQMVAGVAHEINTPLGIVNHAASIITEELNADAIEEVSRDEKVGEVLEGIAMAGKLIQDNIRRADKLITSFKNLSVRQITDEKEDIALSEVIDDVIHLYSIKAKASNLSLDFINEIEEADNWSGYPGQLGQVLMNLITNADRYAYPEESGGRVEIRLSGIGAESDKFDFLISIKDFGAGIEESEQARIFDAFYTTGRSIGGTGIGLSIVHNIVTFQLDGDIELVSSPGEGCQFSVSLPAAVKDKKSGSIDG